MKKVDAIGRVKEVHYYCVTCYLGYPSNIDAHNHHQSTGHVLQLITVKVKK